MSCKCAAHTVQHLFTEYSIHKNISAGMHTNKQTNHLVIATFPPLVVKISKKQCIYRWGMYRYTKSYTSPRFTTSSPTTYSAVNFVEKFSLLGLQGINSLFSFISFAGTFTFQHLQNGFCLTQTQRRHRCTICVVSSEDRKFHLLSIGCIGIQCLS